MTRAWLVALGAILLTACGVAAPPPQVTPTTPTPAPKPKLETRGFLPFITNFGLAQICPVGEYLALTARHVGTAEKGNGAIERVSGFWSAPTGEHGIGWALDYDYRRDVAIMQSSVAFPHVYAVAGEPPAIKSKVTIAGYEYRPGRVPLMARYITTEVINIVATHLVLEEAGVQGFSGSCVLNARNEVVGVYFGTIGLDAGREAGVAAGVWGELGDVSWVPPKQ